MVKLDIESLHTRSSGVEMSPPAGQCCPHPSVSHRTFPTHTWAGFPALKHQTHGRISLKSPVDEPSPSLGSVMRTALLDTRSPSLGAFWLS